MFKETFEFPHIVPPVASREHPLSTLALFGNSNPMEVDVGCGKGRFLLARAASFPNVNFLGIERQRRRIEKTAKKADRTGITNMRIFHAEIGFATEILIPDNAVRCFYVFFPDPWPKRRHNPRRLINPDFLNLLHRKLCSDGIIHFATDHDDYYQAAIPVFENNPLFDSIPPFIPAPEEQTDFELLFAAQGKSAKRLSLQKKPDVQCPL